MPNWLMAARACACAKREPVQVGAACRWTVSRRIKAGRNWEGFQVAVLPLQWRFGVLASS
jgi:hypothetical protein